MYVNPVSSNSSDAILLSPLGAFLQPCKRTISSACYNPVSLNPTLIGNNYVTKTKCRFFTSDLYYSFYSEMRHSFCCNRGYVYHYANQHLNVHLIGYLRKMRLFLLVAISGRLPIMLNRLQSRCPKEQKRMGCSNH